MANEPTDEDRRIADTILAGHEQVLMFGQDSGVLRDDIAAALAAERARTVERCAKWHEEQESLAIEAGHTDDGELYAAMINQATMHRSSAAAIRALGSEK